MKQIKKTILGIELVIGVAVTFWLIATQEYSLAVFSTLDTAAGFQYIKHMSL